MLEHPIVPVQTHEPAEQHVQLDLFPQRPFDLGTVKRLKQQGAKLNWKEPRVGPTSLYWDSQAESRGFIPSSHKELIFFKGWPWG